MAASKAKGISAPRAISSAMSVARSSKRAAARNAQAQNYPDFPPYISFFMIGAAAMAYELLLSRLLAIVQWPHIAFMILSMALLGYGVAGVVLSLFQERMLTRFSNSYLACLTLFAISSVACFIGIEQISFNVQDSLTGNAQSGYTQVWHLLEIYALLAIPFCFAACAVMFGMARFHTKPARIVAASMTGAGVGVLLILATLFAVVPDNALRSIGAFGFATAAVAWLELRVEPRFGSAIFALLGFAIILLPGRWTELQITPSKSLPQALQVGGANLVTERSSPLGMISVIENTMIPWKYAPGLSLRATHEAPEQVGVFTDGDALTVITRPTKNPAEMDYLDQMTSALPYHLRTLQRVLVLGAGGGNEVMQARINRVPLIDAVELNPQIAALVRNEYQTFSGDLYNAPEVKLHIAEPRGFIKESTQRYDLIQISLLDAAAASTAGLYALSENYTYTVEAFRDYLAHLEPGGYLAITRWVNLPPRDALKLFATAVAALEYNGVTDPSEQMFLIRSWQTVTLVIKNGTYTPREIADMQDFCRTRNFDLGYYSGMKEEETNVFNVTDRAYFFMGAKSLLSDTRETFIENNKYNLLPATDDRPYYFHFFKWKNLSELFSPRDKGGVALMEWSYPVLSATLLQTLLTSMVLIFMPLLFSWRLLREIPRGSHVGRILLFCVIIGFASMVSIIVFVQQFTQFLRHPLLVIAVVLPSFFIFGGFGSLFAQRIADARHHTLGVWWSIAIIVILSLVYINISSTLFDLAASWPTLLKILLTIGVIAPLAFCMGLPLSLVLDQISSDVPVLLPWSYGVVHCASVVGAGASMLLAMHVGFTLVTIIGVVLYSIAAWAFPKH